MSASRAFPNDGDILTTSSFATPTAMSCYGWVINPASGVTAGRMFEQLNVQVQLRGTANSFLFAREWSGGTGVWSVTTSLPTWTDWNHFAVTYDGALAANDPILYINGGARTNDDDSNGSGSIVNTASVLSIGNRSSTFAQLGGSLSFFAIHNVVLTPTEILEAMTQGVTARGLFGYWPITGASPEPDQSGNGRDAVVTGTTVGVGPPGVPAVIATANLAPVIYGRGAC